MSKTILVTGAAGFIGSHTVEAFLKRGDRVIGLDNLNDYYDPARKRANLKEIRQALAQTDHSQRFTFIEGDIRDRKLVKQLFEENPFDAIVHLAAMAGVRVSIGNPELYYDVNLMGSLVLLDAAVRRSGQRVSTSKLPSFVYASTSSVYGNTRQIPFVPEDPCDRPLAPYAASKRAGELLGHSYHHLYGLPFTVLRFFTVYGPRGRPDMMAYKVLDNIFTGCEVPLYNGGQMHRDWTYVTDIVNGVVAAADTPLGYEVLNLGRGEPVLLNDFVKQIETLAGQKAHLVNKPMLDADIAYTFADVSKTRERLGYDPKVSVSEGVEHFWKWYQKAILQ
ncbi:MAG: SDR family NAD(P)-dependent oxidoreductase [Nitrospirota bacterium]|nr:MAG: SDR family NAD(P)-dependent oxidoreductase [Nitrospirota bacterium]